MKFSIDFGYGFLKASNEQGNTVIFPSVAGEMQEVSFSLSDNDTGLGITTDDGSWLFGQSAMEQSTFDSHQQNQNWILSDEYKAGILLAITQLSKASRLNVELTLALPFETMQRGGLVKTLIANLAGEHTVKPLGSNSQQITITFPQKFPLVQQNVAPVLRHVIDRYGNVRLPDTTNNNVIYIGLCNGGAHTIELSTCKITQHNGRQPGFQMLKGASRPGGTYSLTGNVRSLLQRRFPDEAAMFNNDHRLFNILSSGEFRSYNLVHDVSRIIAEPKGQYCKSIVHLCGNTWADTTEIMIAQLWGFIASGGGANLFADSLRQWHKNVVVSESPQFDVVEGMRRLRKMVDKEK